MPPPGTWLVLLLFWLPLAASGLAAQRRSPAFETIDLQVSLLADVNRGTLHRYWSPGVALGVGVALPFYVGRLETGLQYAHPDPTSDGVPGFRSLFAFAGWGGAHDLGAGVQVGGGARIGIMAMRFDGDTIPAFRRNESELGIAGRGSLRWMPRGPWFLEGSLLYQSILTTPRMEQLFVSAGVGRRFGTPTWLRDFLD